MLGNGRAECYCYDGVTRLGHIRGKMRKKVWVSAGDIVLVGKRDYQDDKASPVRKALTSTASQKNPERTNYMYYIMRRNTLRVCQSFALFFGTFGYLQEFTRFSPLLGG